MATFRVSSALAFHLFLFHPNISFFFPSLHCNTHHFPPETTLFWFSCWDVNIR